MEKIYIRFGRISFRFECYLEDRKIAYPEEVEKYSDENVEDVNWVEPLTDKQAFEQGVENFNEIFFLYGSLTALAIYEIHKSHLKGIKEKAKNSKLQKETEHAHSCNCKLREDIDDLKR